MNELAKTSERYPLLQVALFLLKLLLLIFFVKTAFILFNGGKEMISFTVIKWSMFYDALITIAVNLPLLLLLLTPVRSRAVMRAMVIFSVAVNFCHFALNVVDIFYFRFHGQRADADLFYVLEDPLSKTFGSNFFVSMVVLLFAGLTLLLLYRITNAFVRRFLSSERGYSVVIILLTVVLLFLLVPRRVLVPTYPLTAVNAIQLPFTQNSLHTFLYSAFRRGEADIRHVNIMKDEIAKSLYPNQVRVSQRGKRNVVLFIMESIPKDYFDINSRFKTTMPFFDSLLKRSKYFSNAYAYSFSSNKGIVALLSGLPTLTDIPLYHTKFTNIPFTNLGSLKNENYSSLFMIGDHYDDFGFAKYCNWAGLGKYYCADDIPGTDTMEHHTMGLHDEYTLRYFFQKIKSSKPPFLAVHFNISTHFPNDLPQHYKVKYPEKNFTSGMKGLEYYDDCLGTFFNMASAEDWYKNTVFIFCSDHWMSPDDRHPESDVLERFKIPIIIFDPADSSSEEIKRPVSQMDVFNAILSYCGFDGEPITYGRDLFDTSINNRVVCMKANEALYQAVDSQYVVGYTPLYNRVEFVYNYKTDPQLKSDQKFFLTKESTRVIDVLKAFIQTAHTHYLSK